MDSPIGRDAERLPRLEVISLIAAMIDICLSLSGFVYRGNPQANPLPTLSLVSGAAALSLRP